MVFIYNEIHNGWEEPSFISNGLRGAANMMANAKRLWHLPIHERDSFDPGFLWLVAQQGNHRV